VNRSITKLFAFILVLYVLLVGFTSNWSVFAQDDLENQEANKRPLLEQQQIARGKIISSDGEVLAVSEPVGHGESKTYKRDYPQGERFGNPVGYDFITQRTGIELSENDVLVGEKNEFASILEQLQGNTEKGSDLTVTLDAGAQKLATDLISAQGAGSLVAIEPSTGAVRAMVSWPGFDPNTVDDPGVLTDLNSIPEGEPSKLLNRATQGRYPPGSTMKVVTAAAAIDSGEYTPDSVVNGNSGVPISGIPLANDAGEDFGDIPLTDALTYSVNTVWAQVAEDLGPETMVEYMKRFGFYSLPELDYPPLQMTASGPRNTDSKLVEDGFDVGRVAIGQGGDEGTMLVTPIQMAEVAAAIANGGKLMKPTFLQQVTDPDGRVTQELDPQEQDQVISEESASELTDMMVNVTEEGTAANLSVGGGAVTFAGKTGTAEKNLEQGINQPWFIMFAPAEDPQIAIAATIEECSGCFGGEVAGPIATQVADYFLNQG
jgi:peptidoglycan glycosyltransferase